jgi:hypothetical protein
LIITNKLLVAKRRQGANRISLGTINHQPKPAWSPLIFLHHLRRETPFINRSYYIGSLFIMSVPYLLNDSKGHVPASQRIPVIARPFVSERAKKILDLVS